MDNHQTFKKLPKDTKSPVAEYYSDIRWQKGYNKWPLVRFSTPADGSCLFHAIANSFFVPYHTQKLYGKHITRKEIISSFRAELSDKLSDPSNKADLVPRTHYDELNDGNTEKFSQWVPEFSVQNMKDQLKSQNPIGYGYMEFIGNVINKDIYILEAARMDIYVADDLHLTIKGNRDSIVLYYEKGHYELVGIRDINNVFNTHLSCEHSFIKFLYSRVLDITSNKKK